MRPLTTRARVALFAVAGLGALALPAIPGLAATGVAPRPW
jgi:hypothetical protein